MSSYVCTHLAPLAMCPLIKASLEGKPTKTQFSNLFKLQDLILVLF